MPHEVRIEGALEGKFHAANGAFESLDLFMFSENMSSETRSLLENGMAKVTSGVGLFIMNETFFSCGKFLFALQASEIYSKAFVSGFALGNAFV